MAHQPSKKATSAQRAMTPFCNRAPELSDSKPAVLHGPDLFKSQWCGSSWRSHIRNRRMAGESGKRELHRMMASLSAGPHLSSQKNMSQECKSFKVFFIGSPIWRPENVPDPVRTMTPCVRVCPCPYVCSASFTRNRVDDVPCSRIPSAHKCRP